MIYKEAMEYIQRTAKFGSNYGLDRTFKILEILGNPHEKIKTIHIAGTNGKGSTTSMITSVLMEHRYKVGMYTSPFLEEFEERMQINKENIPKDKLAFVVTRVKEAVDEVISLGYDNPTEFEIITCAMFLYFYVENVDYAVIEVGLGGRLDATNVITPKLSIIASISYDHMNILGDTLGKIAYEKAGIIKKGVPCITYPQKDEVVNVLRNICNKKNSKLYEIKESEVETLNTKGENFTQKIKVKENKIFNQNKQLEVDLKLLGKHQVLNALLAIRSLQVLNLNSLANISYDNIINGLKKAKWNGRMEVVNKEPLVVIDGAHNMDGIKKLKESINNYFDYENITLIIGVLGDKEVHKMINEVTSLTDKAIVLTPHNNRAAKPEYMLKLMKENGVKAEWCDGYKKGYEKALIISKPNDLILICGSLYMIGDMRKIIVK
jgi:dihydrofolate synthase/folylpolyglutamate synthase